MMPAEKMRVIDLCALRKAKLDAMLKAKQEKAAQENEACEKSD